MYMGWADKEETNEYNELHLSNKVIMGVCLLDQQPLFFLSSFPFLPCSKEENECIQVIKSSWGVCWFRWPLFFRFFFFPCSNCDWLSKHDMGGAHTSMVCVRWPIICLVYDSSLRMSTIVLSQQWASKQPSRHVQNHSRSKTTCVDAGCSLVI